MRCARAQARCATFSALLRAKESPNDYAIARKSLPTASRDTRNPLLCLIYARCYKNPHVAMDARRLLLCRLTAVKNRWGISSPAARFGFGVMRE